MNRRRIHSLRLWRRSLPFRIRPEVRKNGSNFLTSAFPASSLMFATVRDCEGNIKRYRGSRMMQRWLASVLLYSEGGFKRIRGFTSIPDAIARIEGRCLVRPPKNIGAEQEGNMALEYAA